MTHPPTDPDRPTPAPRGPALPKRLALLVVSPGRLGDHLRERPVWWDALLLGALLVAGANLLIPAEVWEDLARAQTLGAASTSADGTPEAAGDLIRIFSSLAAPVVWGLFLLVSAGIMTFLFAFILGDEGRFKQYLAGTAHATLFTALGGVLIAPLRAARRDPTLTLNVGTFLQGALEGSFVGAFLGSLDLFGLWSWIVMGILFSRLDPRRSARSAVALVLAVSGVLIATVAWFQYRALN